MDQLTLYTIQSLSTLIFESLPFRIGTTPSYSNSRLNVNSTFVVREDSGHPKVLVNIFDLTTGVKCFTVSRGSVLSTQWYMYAEPEHVEVARMSIGGFERRADILNISSALMKYGPGVLGKFHRHFYDQAGNQFSWNRRSKYLEKISNPGGGHEESRTRVGVVDHLRDNRFDWEIRLDTAAVDLVTALATAFVTMKTQWPLSGRTSVPGYGGYYAGNKDSVQPEAMQTIHPRSRVSSSGGHNLIPSRDPINLFQGNDKEHLQVFEPPQKSKEPRNFFDPPKFLEYKYHYNL